MIHACRLSRQPRQLFPTCLFVTTLPALHRWRSIKSTIGIPHLIWNNRVVNLLDLLGRQVKTLVMLDAIAEVA